MGYRYKHGGWADRMYSASVMIDGRLRSFTYSSCWAKNSNGNFFDLRMKIERTVGVQVKREDVLDIQLLERRWA